MEKIYMEESQQQGQQQGQKQRQQQGLYRFSIVLSFAVAFFAVFSLASFGIAISQNTGISYAAPLTSDTFTFHVGQTNSGVQEFITGSNDQTGEFFNVPTYYADATSNIPIFCMEQGAAINKGIPYKKTAVLDDYGLLYILNNSSAKNVNIVNGNPIVEKWATQVAIWVYLAEQNPDEKFTSGEKKGEFVHRFADGDLEKIKAANRFKTQDSAVVSAEGVWSKIRTFVDEAKLVDDQKARILSVTKASDELSKTTDDKYYQTALISVVGNPSGTLQTYEVSVSGVDGAKVIDENGKEMKALTGLSPSTKFHVLIPADQVTSKAKMLNVSVTGTFDYLTGNIYMDDGAVYQKVITVTGVNRQEKAGVSFNVVGTPDTGMSASQTIYFIGLIVLLCGVGIVYANAKPVESKQ